MDTGETMSENPVDDGIWTESMDDEYAEAVDFYEGVRDEGVAEAYRELTSAMEETLAGVRDEITQRAGGIQ